MPRRGGGPADRATQLSKALSWLLRHHAESEGFKLLPGGFLPVADILQHRRFTGFTVAEVEAVVRDCPKQRFSLQQGEAGQLLIRANQGHSIDTVEVELQEITEATAAPKVIHGTNMKVGKCWCFSVPMFLYRHGASSRLMD